MVFSLSESNAYVHVHLIKAYFMNIVIPVGCFNVIRDVLILSIPTHVPQVAIPQHYCRHRSTRWWYFYEAKIISVIDIIWSLEKRF